MKEERRDLEADLKILTAIPSDSSEPVNMVHDVVAPHALRRAIEAERQITEKDATIKKLQQDIGNYKSWTPNAWDNAQELVRLREALNDARDSIQVIDVHGEDPRTVTMYCEKTIKLIDSALGEGENP